ncbi:hypothetical protein HGRIS_005650 [Hohenbuehelia grisea]|uniref:DUF6534 domain-containing protein n=1 Tax=Hohenbuehelia grisea TaxID=104357 RepID=A0ABR3JXH5_9AGAR
MSRSSIDLRDNFGAIMLGAMVACVLFGVGCVQTFHYYMHYRNDALIAKASVASLFIFEALHSIFSIQLIYYYLVVNYANPVALLEVHWSAVAVLVITLVFSIAHVGVAFVVPGISYKLRHFGFLVVASKSSVYARISLSLGAAADVLITSIMCYYLREHRSGFQSTDALISRIMAYVIHTGALTSIVECLVLALSFHAAADGINLNLVYLGIYEVVGNLYGNSVMAILNSRKSTRKTAAHSLSTFTNSTNVPGHLPMKITESQTELAQGALKLDHDRSAYVKVHTTRTVHRDVDRSSIDITAQPV